MRLVVPLVARPKGFKAIAGGAMAVKTNSVIVVSEMCLILILAAA
jgi:hypothetical protein